MKWFGRLFCLVAAVGGFAAAHLLAQEGKCGGPARADRERHRADLARPDGDDADPAGAVRADADAPIPVPSTPTPTVPVPPPTTTAPAGCALPPVVTLPPVTTQSGADTASRSADDLDDDHRPLAAAGPRDVAAAVDAAPPSSASTLVAPCASPEQREPVRDGAAADERRSRRETHRSRNRVSVRLAFLLPKADRLFVIVRGPAPSCRIAGYIPVRGRKGANTVFFSGRVHGRRLEPGVYLLSLSTNRRLDPAAATEYVRVVSRRRSVPLPERTPKPSCSDVAGASTSDAIERTVLAEAVREDVEAATHRKPRRRGGRKPDGRRERRRRLGPSGFGRARRSDVRCADEQPFVAIAVLTIVGALLLTMLVLVTRFLRGSWNP